MYAPKIFTGNTIDDLFNFNPFRDFELSERMFDGPRAGRMLTDIKEHDDHYDLEIDLPGMKKDDIKISLENGYLHVSASRSGEKDEKDAEGKVIHHEKYSGTMTRMFYVGDAVHEEDIHAKYDNGVLAISVPKKEEQKQIETAKKIAIE